MLRPSLIASLDNLLSKGKLSGHRADGHRSCRNGGRRRTSSPPCCGAGLDAGRRSWSPVSLAAANGSDDQNSQLAAADVEMITGQVEAAFARLIRLVKRSSGDERNQARVRLLELFEMLRNSDERVLKARRDLITALFKHRWSRC